jgi:predicted metal-dependent hydrolase
MITKEEYEEAQQIVWDYEDQLKNNGVLGDVINCGLDYCRSCMQETETIEICKECEKQK